ncbi:hypothetical protein [Moorena producens]|uniref:hypothetical protein n=1 Tax=Moorena producens TaxID=1155739 RepID=UPI001313E1DC|nr:hypothetical protein [Moorena producens]
MRRLSIQPSVVSRQWSAVGRWPLAVGRWPLAVGHATRTAYFIQKHRLLIS